MAPKVPTRDGEVNVYNLRESTVTSPRVYFVNGIRVTGLEHARTAAYLSVLIERPVWGVYNKTAGTGYVGSLIDLGQSVLDYLHILMGRVFEPPNDLEQDVLDDLLTAMVGRRLAQKLRRPSTVPDDKIPQLLRWLDKFSFVHWNKATIKLFKELASNKATQQRIIAHSQGNLITSDALFMMEYAFG